MNTSDEKVIQGALTRIAQAADPKASCLVRIREASDELTGKELASLRPEQAEVWNRLTVLSRKLEWSEARRCEAFLRGELGKKSDSPVRTSISHTRKGSNPIVFAAGIVGNVSGIGIDVELVSRDISDAAAMRFIDGSERRFGISPLQIWVIKEALFKANPGNEGTLLPHYRIQTFDPGSFSGAAEIAGRKFGFALVNLQEWSVAVAIS